MKETRSLGKAEAHGGYSWVENSFIRELLPRLSGQAVKVYLYLVSKTPYIKKAEQITKQISASEIAAFLGCTSRTIVKALNELETASVIERLGEPGKPNSYRLLATCEENFIGGMKEYSQGYEQNFTPPAKNSSQVEAAKPYGATIRVPLKNSKSSKISKKVAGVGQPRIASKTGLMNPEDALG